MGRRLILDTNFLVDIERGLLSGSLDADDVLAIPAVVLAELRVGVELAANTRMRRRREEALRVTTASIDVLDYTSATAGHHARLKAFTRRNGQPRGAYDLIIAAHAAETGRVLITRDAAARFGNLPGVIAEEP